MRLGRSGVVGLLTDVMEATPCSVDIIQSVEGALARHGLSLLIGNSQNRPGGSTAILRSFQASRVEGIVYAATFHREIEALGEPLSAPGVLVNCFAREFRLARGHPRRGRRRPFRRRSSSRPRTPSRRVSHACATHRGDAHAEGGIDPRLPRGRCLLSRRPRRGRASRVPAPLIARKPLLQRPACSATIGRRQSFAATMRWRCRSTMQPRGLDFRSPPTFRWWASTITAFSQKGLMPPLTTVALAYERMGRLAADLLIEQIGGRQSSEIIRVQGPLVVRDSTAPL